MGAARHPFFFFGTHLFFWVPIFFSGPAPKNGCFFFWHPFFGCFLKKRPIFWHPKKKMGADFLVKKKKKDPFFGHPKKMGAKNGCFFNFVFADLGAEILFFLHQKISLGAKKKTPIFGCRARKKNWHPKK